MARESGTQILEFGLVALMFIPMMMGSFVMGINLVRSIQANHMARDLANMYIHGVDFSDKAMQRVAKKLATGLDLQVGTATGNAADNVSNSGRGVVWVSKLMYVGQDTNPRSASCIAAGAVGQCTNHDKFVFVEHVRFGNGALQTERDAIVGHPGAARDTFGRIVPDVVKTANAAVPDPQQTSIRNQWQISTNGRAPLEDKQFIYLVEVYFKSPDLNLGALRSNGVYARWFF
jgi:hypothetical protein